MDTRRLLARRSGRLLDAGISAGRSGAAPSGGGAYTPLTEPDIAAWFDHGSGYAVDGSNRLSALVDRRGVYSLGQASGPAQPLWSATGILNHAAAYYTTDDWMSTLDASLANLLDGSQQITVYAVVKKDTSLKAERFWCFGDSGSGSQRIQLGTLVSGADIGDRGGAATGTQTPGTGAVRVTYSWNGSNNLTWVGSTASENSADANTPTCDRLFFGAQRFGGGFANYFSGWMGDWLAFTTSHNGTTRSRIWSYLQSVYTGLA